MRGLPEGAPSSVTQVNTVWLVGRHGTRSVSVPAEDAVRMDRLVDIMAAGARCPHDALNDGVHRHLLLPLLSWARRHHDDARTDGSMSDDVVDAPGTKSLSAAPAQPVVRGVHA
ncbi:hypothetical protein [Streptomyces sp. HUAS ZL42]|uniref:hypothetical protein n=1 Tax=Streptomyces sp. HUAS ZL42 TaxID=3231715 RepID=UPI00345E4740